MTTESREDQRLARVWGRWLETVLSKGPIEALELRDGRTVVHRIDLPAPEDMGSLAGVALDYAEERGRKVYLGVYALGAPGTRAIAHIDSRVSPEKESERDEVIKALIAQQTETMSQMRQMTATVTNGVAAIVAAQNTTIESLSNALKASSERATVEKDRADKIDQQAADLERAALELEAKVKRLELDDRDKKLLMFLMGAAKETLSSWAVSPKLQSSPTPEKTGDKPEAS